MSLTKELNTEKYSTKSQRFDELLEEGISLIQKFSGENWTDYNYHDPGITILEQLCYAITDLGYKSNFQIEDLLMIGVDNFDFEKKNLFIPADKIFSSNPTTFNDYRRLVIDSVELVNNVWFEVVKINNNIHGLFDVKVQLTDNIDHDEANQAIEKIKNILNENRALCADLNEIIILNKDTISIRVDIEIDSFYVGEEILAKVFTQVEKRLNDKVKFVGLEHFENLDVGVEEIFQGIRTKKGIILEDNLNDKTNQVYISEIVEIIRNIEGIINLKNFVIFKNGIRVYEDIISFSETSYPSFENIDIYFSENSESEINFFRNNSSYKIDKTIFSQIYDSLSLNHLPIIKKYNKTSNQKGRFTLDQLSKYYSIINEFPANYGLKEKELPQNVSNLRKAQMKQLKAFLLLFDQLMCNYTAQIANIRNIFSIDHLEKTFFSYIPSDIESIEEILKPQKKEDYKTKIENISEDHYSFVKRRNSFLDHMLSRFGESFNSDLLKKIHQNENPQLTEIDCEIYAIKCKINYLKNVENLGMNRNKAQNFQSNDYNYSLNSGLENRIKLLLDIKETNIETKMEFDNKIFEFKEKYKWAIKDVKIKRGPTIRILSLPDLSYKNGKVNFHLKNYSFFKDLFANAVNEKSFKIINTEEKYIIIYNSPELIEPVKIFVSKEKEDCIIKIKKIISKIKNLNSRSEGFLIIENILLRPVNTDKYSLDILNNDEKLLFKSFKINDFNKLSELRDDLKDILIDKSNYSIHRAGNNSKVFKVSIFDVMDAKIFESQNTYKSREDAKNQINNFIEDHLKKSKVKFEIVSQGSATNNFPDNFNYSNEINVIFPQWPSRFQNVEFKKYINEILESFTPAYIKYNLHFLDFKNLKNIADRYTAWKTEKIKNVKDNIDILSLELIQILLKINNEK